MQNEFDLQSPQELSITSEGVSSSWKNLVNSIKEELIPGIAITAFRLGKASNKKRRYIEKTSPEEYGLLMETIEKGRKLFSFSDCAKCGATYNDKDSFCKKCGNNFKK